MTFDPSAHVITQKRVNRKTGVTTEYTYLPVKWRLAWLRDEQPDALLTTEITHFDPAAQAIVMKATVTLPSGASATGHARKTYDDFPAGYIERCETAATGRALGALGFGTEYATEPGNDDDDEGVYPGTYPIADDAQPAPTDRTGTGTGTRTGTRTATPARADASDRPRSPAPAHLAEVIATIQSAPDIRTLNQAIAAAQKAQKAGTIPSTDWNTLYTAYTTRQKILAQT